MKDLLTRIGNAELSARRVTRRQLLRYSAGAGLAAAALPLLAACGGDDDDSGSTSPTATRASGTSATANTSGATGTPAATGTGATKASGTGTTTSGSGTTPTSGTTTTTTGAGKTPTGGSASGSTVTATLSEFSIKLSPASISAGSITIDAVNDGTMEHQLHIIKTDTAEGSLPMDSTGASVDESKAGDVVGKIDNIAKGDTKSETIDLKAGKYVLICNIPGHYKAGMHVTLDVI